MPSQCPVHAPSRWWGRFYLQPREKMRWKRRRCGNCIFFVFCEPSWTIILSAFRGWSSCCKLVYWHVPTLFLVLCLPLRLAVLIWDPSGEVSSTSPFFVFCARSTSRACRGGYRSRRRDRMGKSEMRRMNVLFVRSRLCIYTCYLVLTVLACVMNLIFLYCVVRVMSSSWKSLRQLLFHKPDLSKQKEHVVALWLYS